MAIGQMVYPQVIGFGFVTRITERKFGMNHPENPGKRYGFQVWVSQDDGGILKVNIAEKGRGGDFESQHALFESELPQLAEQWFFLADVSESTQYGASLRYAGSPASILDLALSSLSASAKS